MLWSRPPPRVRRSFASEGTTDTGEEDIGFLGSASEPVWSTEAESGNHTCQLWGRLGAQTSAVGILGHWRVRWHCGEELISHHVCRTRGNPDQVGTTRFPPKHQTHDLIEVLKNFVPKISGYETTKLGSSFSFCTTPNTRGRPGRGIVRGDMQSALMNSLKGATPSPSTTPSVTRACVSISFNSTGGKVKSQNEREMIVAQMGPFGELRVTPLMKACADGDLELVHRILEEIDRDVLPAELSAVDHWAESSCLHWAAYSGNAAIVEELLALRADPSQRNKRGHALPLHLAARYNHSGRVIRLLCRQSPAELLDAANAHGNTALHEACYENRPQTVATLLECGASVELQNKEARGGLTPLLAAAQYGNVEVVKMLLRAGADPSVAPMSAIPGVDFPVEESAQTALEFGRFKGKHGGTLRRISSGSRSQRGSLAAIGIPKRYAEDKQAAAQLLQLPGYGALAVALRAGQLRVAIALLENLYARHGSAPPLFTRAQLTHVVVRLWAIEGPMHELLTQDETVR